MAISARTRRYAESAFADRASADEIADAIDVIAAISAAELAAIDGVTAGTAAASKAVVLSAGADVTYPEASDWSFGTTTGTKLGTAVSQKLGFWNASPVIQQASANQTAVTDNTGGSVADAIAAVITAPTALTDNGGGTADGTVQAQSTFAASVGWDGATVFPSAADEAALTAIALAIRNNLREVTAAQEEDRLAIIALTNGLAKTIELVNSIRSALVTVGIIKGSA